MSRNSVTRAAAIKLGVFTVCSLFITGVLAAIMGNIGFGGASEYHAVFSNASTLDDGDDVRVAGVSVGEVTGVEHHGEGQALVTFRVADDVPLTTASRAEIRFLNLVGDRYLAIEEGIRAGAAAPLLEGATIPLSRTEPSLDLTVLFNGFQPLFQALEPAQVNELSLNLVQVLQGEGGTIRSLLQHTASLTSALADRDQLIGEVIANLDTTLATVDKHHGELNQLVVELKGWMEQLARDRMVIGSSLGNVGQLTKVVADLLTQARPLLKEDIAQLRQLAALLTRPENRKVVVKMLNRLPEMMTDQTRTGTYGSWYNYYLCGFSGKIKLPVISDLPGLSDLQEQLNNISFHSTAARCNR